MSDVQRHRVRPMASTSGRQAHGFSAVHLAWQTPFALLLTLVLWAPVPLASNRGWPLALLALAAWAALVVALAAALATQPQAAWARIKQAWLPLGLCAGLVMLCGAQVAWGGSSLATSPLAFTTLDGFAARNFLLRTCTYAGLFLLVLVVVDSATRVRWLLGMVLASGLLQAVLAILMRTGTEPYVYFFESFSPYDRAHGTFANPDHLAGFMELTLSAGLGLLVLDMGQARKVPAGWRGTVMQVLEFVMSRKMLLRLGMVLMVLALVMTHSRAGNAAFFLSLLVVGGLVARASSRLRKPALWLVASMALVDVAVVGQWVGVDRLVERMQGTAEASSQTLATFGLEGTPPRPRTEESLADRLTIPRLGAALVPQSPWWGQGGGSFALAFAPFKPATAYAGQWNYAHSDYVQMAVETGLVGLALWVGLGLAAALCALPLLKDGQGRLNRGPAVAALMALCCLAIHSIVDFNLQMPANAAVLTVLLALVWSVRTLPPLEDEQASSGPRRSRRSSESE